MKVQVRRNILTHLWEVQTRQDGQAKWNKVKEFKNEQDARMHAKLVEGAQFIKEKIKPAQNAKKKAKKSKKAAKE